MGRNCLDIPEDVLYQKYIVEELSTIEISKLLNVSNVTIYNYLHMYNISIRSRSEAMLVKNGHTFNKWDLYYYYIVMEMPSTKIAKIFNCDHSLILK